MGDDPELNRLGKEKDWAKQWLVEPKRDLDHAFEVYSRLRSHNQGRLDYLKEEGDREHQNMLEAQRQRQHCYEFGQHDQIGYWRDQASHHRDLRDRHQEERKGLLTELIEARDRFYSCRDRYREKRAEFDRAQEAFNARLQWLKDQREIQRKARDDHRRRYGDEH
ncbi:hypothetical protein [Pseudofrankia sp. DC12]|uniref:hypothetical protein n=1 Tax=Pseudofrankia sp. DC12 TaxID=683315 RepID=UPI0012FBF3AB|nr:hypothetical protein [Pseudofrankia sp. DC12]